MLCVCAFSFYINDISFCFLPFSFSHVLLKSIHIAVHTSNPLLLTACVTTVCLYYVFPEYSHNNRQQDCLQLPDTTNNTVMNSFVHVPLKAYMRISFGTYTRKQNVCMYLAWLRTLKLLDGSLGWLHQSAVLTSVYEDPCIPTFSLTLDIFQLSSFCQSNNYKVMFVLVCSSLITNEFLSISWYIS